MMKATPYTILLRFGRAIACVFALLACPLAMSAAYPAGHQVAGDLNLPPGSTQAAVGQGMRLFGAPADIRLVEIPLSIERAIAALTELYPALADLGVFPGLAVLSGAIGRDLWLVSLQASGAQHTRGTVAVLRPHPNAAASLPRRPDWLPGSARLRFDFSDEADGVHTRQQVWTLEQPLGKLRAASTQGLRVQGWQAVASGGAAEHWVRDRTSLQLVYVATGAVSGVLVHEHTKDEP